MDREEVIERLLRNARENGATDAVVVEVPADVLRDAGATYTEDGEGSEGEPRVATDLVAGPVSEEDDETITLRTPSRVGAEGDFSPEVRRRLRPDGVYGFRDGNLGGVPLPKDEVVVHRVG